MPVSGSGIAIDLFRLVLGVDGVSDATAVDRRRRADLLPAAVPELGVAAVLRRAPTISTASSSPPSCGCCSFLAEDDRNLETLPPLFVAAGDGVPAGADFWRDAELSRSTKK